MAPTQIDKGLVVQKIRDFNLMCKEDAWTVEKVQELIQLLTSMLPPKR